MGQVILIFGTLIALNLGFGFWLSEQVETENPEEGVVEIESIPAGEEYPEQKQSAE